MKKYIAIALLALLVVAAFWLFEGDIEKQLVDARYTNAESEFLTTAEGARVHFRDQGRESGRPLVLVHGSNASLHTWEPWIMELGKSYRVITLDLPGHGLTGAVPNNRYDTQAQLETLAALVDHLKIERFVLGGNSMGGGVTWRYALQHPQQVAGMLLLDASGLAQWRRERETDADDNDGPLVFRLLGKAWFRSIAAYLDTRALTGQGLRSAFHDKDKVTDDMIDLYYDMSMRAGTRRATLARFAGYKPEDSGAEPTEADLSTLNVPTLILWGETDALTPVRNAHRFSQVLPNAKLIVYPEVGHLPMEEIPLRSATDALDFLQAELNW